MATLQTFGGGTTDFILDPGNDAKPLPNAPYTVIDGVTMLPASGLTDANGVAVTQLVSDADGRYAGSALLEGSTYWLDCVGSRGPFRAGPQVSTTALAEVVAMGPQLNTIAASAAASAFSAKQAQSAAEAAASGATAPTATAISTYFGGDAKAMLTGKVAKGDLFLNVRDFSAKGDGSTDDTAAIQAALDAAFAVPGSTVRVVPGTYKITDTLVVRANTTIDARGATINGYWTNPGGTLLLSNGYPGDTPTGYDGHGNITVLGGVWDSRGHLNADGISNGFAFAHATGLTFRDVTVRNLSQGHCLDCTGNRRVRLVNCRFEGFRAAVAAGGTRLSEAVQLDVATSGGFPRFGSYDSTPALDILMEGCFVGPSADLPGWTRAIGSHSSRTDRPYLNVKVIGNHFECTEYAVRAYNWRDFTIAGNTVNGAGIEVMAIDAASTGDTFNAAGVQTGASAEIGPGSIAGNVITGSVEHGIYLLGYAVSGLIRGVTVTGNTVRGNASASRQCIRLDNTVGCVVSGNTVRDSLDNTVQVIRATNATVANNQLYRGALHGLVVDSSTGCTIVGNSLTEPGQRGVSVTSSGADHAIKNNTVVGASYATHNTWDGIWVASVSNCAVVGNTVRRGSAANQTKNGINITSGTVGTFYTANDLRTSGVTSSVVDNGTGSLTTATNQL